MDAAAKIGRNPVRKHQFQPDCVWRVSGLTERPNVSRETKFSDANGDREKNIFPVQLTTNRIGNLTQLIHALLLP